MNISMLVKGLALGSLAVASTAFAAPKMGGDMYGIAGASYATAGLSPFTIEAGVGKKISKDVSAEVIGSVTPGSTYTHYAGCSTSYGALITVGARGIYHIPVDFAGIKPYVGAGFGYGISPSAKVSCEGLTIASGPSYGGFGFSYAAGVEYPLSNKTKLYFDAGGAGAGAWGGSAGVKMGF